MTKKIEEKSDLTRRNLLGRAGLALGGLVSLGALQGCGDGGGTTEEPPPPPPTGPQVNEFPYQQHLPDGYAMADLPAVQEAAYHGYYAGGCCHGAYSAILAKLAADVGAPYDKLPLDFGKFGGGGIASYGSICGAVLGGVLHINMMVADATARGNMMTDLMRWYERTAFPMYSPAAVDAAETGLTLDFSQSNLVQLGVVPGTHLCHGSVTRWCSEMGVAAGGADKKARCARLTADVAGKVAEMLNAYLANAAYTPAGRDDTSNTCVACHTPATTNKPPVASGMECASCHSDKVEGHPGL
ncbi:MAG: C-GCAxxG-C-C family protein [Anaeromyxobacter sp.]